MFSDETNSIISQYIDNKLLKVISELPICTSIFIIHSRFSMSQSSPDDLNFTELKFDQLVDDEEAWNSAIFKAGMDWRSTHDTIPLIMIMISEGILRDIDIIGIATSDGSNDIVTAIPFEIVDNVVVLHRDKSEVYDSGADMLHSFFFGHASGGFNNDSRMN